MMTTAGRSLRDVYLARQPIFDRQQRVYAYEILFRNSAENRAEIGDANRATSELLLNLFVEVGIDNVTGSQKAFVNFGREFLIGKLPLPLAPDRLVLEILEDVEIDAELVAGVAALVDHGYTLALDDVVYHKELEPLLGLAKIVKVELPRIPPLELAGHVKCFRRFPVRLLAEKVETQEEFEYCKSLGFDLFQGFFLARPQMLKGRQQRTSQLAMLQLLVRSCDPTVSIDELERLVNGDPAFSYKLLRYINSLKFALPHRIKSLRQAIVLLGIQGVRTLVVLVGLARISEKPNEILTNSIIRARLCERLGELCRSCDTHVYFTAGLLSSLDALLDMPLVEVVDSLHLTDELRQAVLHHAGSVGLAVRAVIAQERGDWPQIEFADLTPSEIRGAYVSAIGEARAIWRGQPR